ncbi:putative GAF sensor protein [Solidesulfovibrio fructosivorans JJ]]|uniref:Putative GAF sensor protein n=1 Tax=Solidesulfovibrio fructosivorans JJ] TaxID=596151 RepID=E1JSY5_SOLFR|nr:GAF domain-containing protein [Solidesulfovibrio fructosivorans]EFL52618.1 putative GAF sensor protein [Solidesulfovibrio fructosivorans JJ]]
MALHEHTTAIYELARLINMSLKPGEVLSLIAEHTAKAMRAKGCFIRLLSRDGKILEPGAYYGLSDRYAHKGPVEVAKSRLDQEVLKGEILTIADVSKDDRFQYPKEAADEGLCSLVVAPLSVGGDRIIGSIRVYSAECRTFSAEDLEFVRCIANLSGLALENARMYAALSRAKQLADEYTYQVFEE